MSGLVMSGVTVRAGGRAIVSDASLAALPGTITGLIGPNGAGKSTLLAATLGLRTRDSGTVRFDGEDLAAMTAAARARLCAYVEQFATTTERLTARDAVSLGRIPYQSAWQGSPDTADEAVIDESLEAVGMSGFGARAYHTLSGGEQQRVQVARALAQEPRLLLLDEPTSHLDIQAQLLILDLLQKRARAGATVVIAMHDLNLAARFCDRLVVLRAGRVAAQGTPANVLQPELLLDVYGVRAVVLKAPGTGHPLIAYDAALPYAGVPKAD